MLRMQARKMKDKNMIVVCVGRWMLMLHCKDLKMPIQPVDFDQVDQEQ